ncbi:MAG: hypothetical protein GY819_02320 [Planctomycetaceae bacterium]|nr:hypothetical protein [Planctomycetaceae bacterium]MCP4461616.1 hypothetical protein [Planctomycetaceae bacterium]MDG1807699.1 hypothetical protein [Pirellulaceae bacterium]MDG2105688.1 hypothetical protein [Pirellulaceae bacterium]
MTQKQVETQVDTIVDLRKEVTDLKNKLAESSKQSKNAFRLFLFTWVLYACVLPLSNLVLHWSFEDVDASTTETEIYQIHP